MRELLVTDGKNNDEKHSTRQTNKHETPNHQKGISHDHQTTEYQIRKSSERQKG